MNTIGTYIFVSLIALFSASGCAAFQAGTDVEAGRKAFLIGDNEVALGNFQSAAQVAPDYVYYGMGLRENIWSYVGRSEYAAGRLAQARQTLEKALSPNRDEYGLSLDGDWDMARLYLGLTLARSGDRQQGLKEIEGDLAMLSRKDVDVQKLIGDGEWLGKRVEEEINLARRDEREDLLRQN